MPWTAKQFKSKHWKAATISQAKRAARIANRLLKKGYSEGKAIAIAIAQARKSGSKSRKQRLLEHLRK